MATVGQTLPSFTVEQVAQHNKEGDAYIIIDSFVYDISKFAAMHPGGEKLLLSYAGKDATTDFYALHRQEILTKYAPRLLIGSIAGASPTIIPPTPGSISIVPYAEPAAWMGLKSPYYNDSHRRFRKEVRTFIQTKISPEAPVNEETGKAATKELFLEMGKAGLLAARIGPGPHLSLPPSLLGGIAPKDFDYFHEMIAHEEIAAVGCPGYGDSLGTGMVIGLPPLLKFGSKALQERVVPLVLAGEKRICLAISEPTAGSDVAAIRTTGVKSPDGKFYIVNGIKKWITGGMESHFFSTAVRTESGISMLLIERSDGLETKSIKTSYSSAAGTSLVIMEDVKVPVENMLGKEGQGFLVIMYNFNHERWMIAAGVTSYTRLVVQECFKWANQRMVFGKSLLEQPVIRQKLAHMVSQVEGVHSWLENITYQMNNMSYKEQSIKLGGPIALLKLLCTRVAHYVSDEACQIFGGRAITKTGMGRVIESFQRTYKFGSILGGSEEIMADLGIRQAMKGFPPARL